MHPAKNNRILVIDDNPGIHKDFHKVLGPPAGQGGDDLDWIKADLLGEEPPPEAEAPFELESAFQGQEGLEKVRAALAEGRPYALAFVDVRMPPGWDGIETIGHIWKVDPELEVVVCSAFSDYGWDEIVNKVGKTDRLLILKKPFEGVEVTQIAHALTRKWALQQSVRVRAEELADLVKARTEELEVANRLLAQEMKDRQHMESELRLGQKLEAVGQLAAGIAHEINTPMQYIGDNTRFLETAFKNVIDVVQAYQLVVDQAGGEEIEPVVAEAKSAARRAKLDFLKKRVPRALEATIEGVSNVSRIVRAMKNFSHVGSDEMALTDINSAVDATITISKSEWKYVADVEVNLDSTLPLVPCLAGELNQVVLNIIVNGAHAIGDIVQKDSEEKGKITICTRVVDGFAEITIQDTGGGIPDSVRDRIYDPFFTTKEVGKGTGQGLAIARSIVVDKHRGQLFFETEKGKGTTFHIRLPLKAEEVATEGAA